MATQGKTPEGAGKGAKGGGKKQVAAGLGSAARLLRAMRRGEEAALVALLRENRVALAPEAALWEELARKLPDPAPMACRPGWLQGSWTC